MDSDDAEQNRGKSSIKPFLWSLFLGLGTMFWITFGNDVYQVNAATAAWCSDGEAGYNSSNLVYTVTTAGDEDALASYIHCEFPVQVYNCLETSTTGGCLSASSEPSKTSVRQESTGFGCSTSEGVSACSGKGTAARCVLPFWDEAWECGHGSCSAFDKAAEICQEKMRSESYSCYVYFDQLHHSVRDDPASFPVMFAILGIICTLAFLLCSLCIALSVKSIKELSLYATQAASTCFPMMCCCCIIPGLIASLVGHFSKPPAPQRMNAIHGEVVGAAEEDVQSNLSWSDTLLIAILVVFGLSCCSLFCGAVGLGCYEGYQEVQREQAQQMQKADTVVLGAPAIVDESHAGGKSSNMLMRSMSTVSVSASTKATETRNAAKAMGALFAAKPTSEVAKVNIQQGNEADNAGP